MQKISTCPNSSGIVFEVTVMSEGKFRQWCRDFRIDGVKSDASNKMKLSGRTLIVNRP